MRVASLCWGMNVAANRKRKRILDAAKSEEGNFIFY